MEHDFRNIEREQKLFHEYRDAVDRSVIVSKTDKNGIITFVNEKFSQISGYTTQELIGKPHNIIRHPDTSGEVFKELWKNVLNMEAWEGVIKNRKKDGTTYWVHTVINPILDENGNIFELIAIRHDVTELEEYKLFLKHELDITSKNFEEKLHYTSQYEEAINSTTAIVKTDTDNTITYLNDKFCHLSGYVPQELIGRNCEVLSHEKQRLEEICKQTGDELSKKKTVQKIMTNIAKDNHEYVVNNLFYPIRDLKGNVIEYMQIMHDVTEITNLNKEIINTQREIVSTMGTIGESRSHETGLHVKRVAEYSYVLAKLVGLSEEEATLLKEASPMHDIGKVGIPDDILNKPGKLTSNEFDIMKTHAQLGYEMLKSSERPILKTSAIVAYSHHEKWDGSGYPRGLKGKDIPIYGRITAIADVFDALGHDRVYKKAWPLEKILELFRDERGKHFDPKMIHLFFEHLDQFLTIRENMQD